MNILDTFSTISFSTSQMLAMLFYVVTMVGTPGPNNIMLTSSGANFGYRRSIPHIIGIHLGVFSMLCLMAMGLYTLFEAYPASRQALFVIGAAYLIWLAYRIATLPLTVIEKSSSQAGQARPLSVIQAALFQYVNPKAWVMASNAIVFYAITGSAYIASVVVIVLTFFLAGFAINSAWVMFGSMIGRLLKTARAWRIFNVSMAGLLLVCLPLML